MQAPADLDRTWKQNSDASMAQIDLSMLEAVGHLEPKVAPGGYAQEALSIAVPQVPVAAVPKPVLQAQRMQARMAGAAAAASSRLLSQRHVNRCGPGCRTPNLFLQEQQ